MLDFRPGAKRALPARAQVDRIDRGFLFGNARHPVHPWAHPFASRLRIVQVSRGLALVITNYPIIYLDFDTAPVSAGAGPVTLTPGVGV